MPDERPRARANKQVFFSAFMFVPFKLFDGSTPMLATSAGQRTFIA